MAATRSAPYAEPDIEATTTPDVTTKPKVTKAPEPVHELTISETGSFARAVCVTCGWEGPGRRSRAVASTDADAHG